MKNSAIHFLRRKPMRRNCFLRSTVLSTSSVFFVVLLFSSVAFGQAGTATLRGTVKDPQGNVVPGATVTLSNVGTKTSRTTTSDLGTYSFELVPVGDYQIEVEGRGFKKAVITDVHALVSKVTPVDIAL